MTASGDRPFWDKVNHLFHQALEVPASDRARFVAEACVDDERLATEVASLLAAHEGAGEFLEQPAGSAEALLDRAFDSRDDRVGRTIGHYRIERLLGAGGMGVVYLATDTRLERPVALKAIAARFVGDPVRRERLWREARAAAALTHPGIAAVYAMEELDGQTFLIGEYVPGNTLREELARGALALDVALGTAVDIAKALAAAHGRGIVHRDLKPENIMRAPDGSLKILDFGLAQVATPSGASRLTADGAQLGTPAYMSPEQIRGQAVDRRSDVFAMGALLHELIVGTPPFRGETPSATMARILESARDPLRRPDLQMLPSDFTMLRAIDAIVGRCLEKDPAARFADAAELARALTLLRDGSPMKPDPSPIPGHASGRSDERLWWWQFHQAAASVSYLLLLIPLWAARDLSPGWPGMVAFVAGLAAAVSAIALRLHLWFAVRTYPDEWSRLKTESSTLMRAADSVFVVALATGGLLVIDEYRYLGALLVAAAAGVFVSFAVIEPSTTRAASRS